LVFLDGGREKRKVWQKKLGGNCPGPRNRTWKKRQVQLQEMKFQGQTVNRQIFTRETNNFGKKKLFLGGFAGQRGGIESQGGDRKTWKLKRSLEGKLSLTFENKLSVRPNKMWRFRSNKKVRLREEFSSGGRGGKQARVDIGSWERGFW